MKKLSEKLEKVFVAVAFAEEGEFDAARRIMSSDADTGEKTGKRAEENYSPSKLTVHTAGISK